MSKWLLLLVIFCGWVSPVSADVTGPATVTDGDSIKIAGQKIRLLGIDAPEGRQFCEAEGTKYPCGAMATSWLVQQTLGETVRCEGSQKDKYRRLLAICFVDDKNLNAGIVSAGLALAYRHYSSTFISQEDEARSAKRGLWRGQFVKPWDWRRGKRLSSGSVTPQPGKKLCCKTCRKGQACGNSCISRRYRCKRPPGCACDG